MMLLSVHSILAGVVQQPALELTPKEASELTKGIANVQQHYPVVIDPKIQAWFSLGTVVAAIYVPKVFVMRMAASQKNAPSRQPAQEAQKKPTPADVKPRDPGPMTPSQMFGQEFTRG